MDIEVQHLKQQIKTVNSLYPKEYLKYFEEECERREASVSSTWAESNINQILNKKVKKTKLERLEERFYSFDYHDKYF